MCFEIVWEKISKKIICKIFLGTDVLICYEKANPPVKFKKLFVYLYKIIIYKS